MNRPWTNVSNFRTYITSGVVDYTWLEASDFCQSQHTAGLVTWDTVEKYKDVKFIVNPDGEGSPETFTALFNENKIDCDYAAGCDGQLVSIMLSYVRHYCALALALPHFSYSNGNLTQSLAPLLMRDSMSMWLKISSEEHAFRFNL